MDFGPPLQGKASTVQDATRSLQDALRSAREGEFAEALDGSVLVSQAISAAMFKKGQEAIAKYERDLIAEKEKAATLQRELLGEKEKTATLQRELAAEREKTATLQSQLDTERVERKAVETRLPNDSTIVIITQVGHPTKSYNNFRKQSLHQLLTQYAEETGQHRLPALAVQTNAGPNYGSKIAPQNFEIVPARVDSIGPRYYVFELKESVNIRYCDTKRVDLILTQPGYGTRVFDIQAERSLADALSVYAQQTDQDVSTLQLFSNFADDCGRVINAETKTLTPRDVDSEGAQYVACEVRRVVQPGKKRSAASSPITPPTSVTSTSPTGPSRKRQKLL